MLTTGGMQLLTSKARSVSPNRSNFITNSSFVNCNHRFKDFIKGGDVEELWKIANDLGVHCSLDVERVIQRFSELDQRDATLLSEIRREGRQDAI